MMQRREHSKKHDVRPYMVLLVLVCLVLLSFIAVFIATNQSFFTEPQIEKIMSKPKTEEPTPQLVEPSVKVEIEQEEEEEPLAAASEQVGSYKMENVAQLKESASFEQVKASVLALEQAGYKVGFYLVSLDGTRTLAYGEHEVFYPASSMKAPYIMALYQRLLTNSVEISQTTKQTVRNCIVNSDNDAYRNLHTSYGWAFFKAYAETAGVVDGKLAIFGSNNYPPCSAQDLAKLWQASSSFVLGQSAEAAELRGYLQERSTSAFAQAITGKDVYSKAGWFYSYDKFNSAPSATEAGIVKSGDEGYVLAIMSNVPGDLTQIQPLAAALDAFYTEVDARTA